MKNMILTLVLTLALVGCTDETNAVRTLKAAGYTDIQVGGYAWMSCGKDDSFATDRG